jgi:hypothetical protein
VSQQFGSSRRVNESHVAFVNAHGLKACVADFIFRVDEGVANGVKIVVSHRVGQNQYSLKFKAFGGLRFAKMKAGFAGPLRSKL